MRCDAACWCCNRERGKPQGWCTQNGPAAAGRSRHRLQLQPTEGWGAAGLRLPRCLGAPLPAPLHHPSSSLPGPSGWLRPAACAGSLRGMGRACEVGTGRSCTLGRAVGPAAPRNRPASARPTPRGRPIVAQPGSGRRAAVQGSQRLPSKGQSVAGEGAPAAAATAAPTNRAASSATRLIVI